MFYFSNGINRIVCVDLSVCDLFHFCVFPSFFFFLSEPFSTRDFMIQGMMFSPVSLTLIYSNSPSLHSFVPSLSPIPLEFPIKQSCFNQIWGFQWAQKSSFSLISLFLPHLVLIIPLLFSFLTLRSTSLTSLPSGVFNGLSSLISLHSLFHFTLSHLSISSSGSWHQQSLFPFFRCI